jgi:ligand-binding SRPBCC domain-containing protein
MAEHIFRSEQTIALPRDEVFEFFANAENLERITPKELNFKITSPQPIEMREGALIDYRLSLHGIPMNWRTEITLWNPPYEFVDTQLKGPYSQWIHHHKFTEIDANTTLIEDEVKYRLPLEPLGDLAHFIVKGQLDGIFAYRREVVEEMMQTSSR